MPTLKEFEHSGGEEFKPDEVNSPINSRRKIVSEKESEAKKALEEALEQKEIMDQAAWLSPENPFLWDNSILD